MAVSSSLLTMSLSAFLLVFTQVNSSFPEALLLESLAVQQLLLSTVIISCDVYDRNDNKLFKVWL